MKQSKSLNRWWGAVNPVVFPVLIWFAVLLLAAAVSVWFVPLRTGYLGPVPWANFDGIHYLKIARDGYFQYGEAFFPLYPLIIRYLSYVLPIIAPFFIAMAVSLTSFICALVLLYRMEAKLDKGAAGNLILLYLAFPTAFFFMAVYTEGLFLFLSVLAYYLAMEKRWLASAVVIALASATRLVGIFLIIPLIWEYFSSGQKRPAVAAGAIGVSSLGLLSYMAFLYGRTGDALRFFHVQSAFGAGRSSGNIILLPQVLWRYGKIIFTAFLQPTPVSYAVTILELAVTGLAAWVLWMAWKIRLNRGLFLYAFVSLLIPTLTGTLSSMPRYVLAAFPLFVAAARLIGSNRMRRIAVASGFLEIVLTILFVRGWFVA